MGLKRIFCSLSLLVSVSSNVVSAQPVIRPMQKAGAPVAKLAPRVVEQRPSKEGADFFENKIRPVLVKHCYSCHSGDPAKAKAHFVLDNHAGMAKGGDSGEVIVPNHPDKSLLIEALKYEGLQMPPSGQLSDEIVADFVKWIEMGAPDPRVGKAANPKNKIDLAEARRYWAFQHPKPSPLPLVKDKAWTHSDLDYYVLAKLEHEYLTPAPDADRITLIRRLTFDLTGLPPTPDEIDAFINDTFPQAIPKVVDRLLESPRFGERWGRHWLDVVRYAESSGKERNLPYRYAWKYRDYVIDAFNADKPYDKFIVEQLAGDILYEKNPTQRSKSLLIATGFLAIGPKSAATNNPEQFKVDVVDDQIDVTGRAFLGMTIACARCHDHKFDPIPQTDYYAIAGIFHSTETLGGVKPGRKTVAEEKLLTVPGETAQKDKETSKENDDRKHEIAKLETEIKELQREMRQATKPAAKGKKTSPAPAKVDKKQVRDEIKKLEDKLEELEGQVPASGNLAMGVREGEIADSHLLVRGELKEKGPEVPRGVLTVLNTGMRCDTHHSGRMQLANWIADKNNPLTARVMVNRIWSHLFGQGLVDTVDNFGALGDEPTHPDLLDHLALQFMNNQHWSVKKAIRAMVLSHTYQLGSDHSDENYEKDPGNKYLWRMTRRRLDAEEIRDAMLLASGQLSLDRPDGSPVMELSNRTVGGGKGMQDVRKPSNVRSVYLPILRGLVPDMLGTFDVADPNLIVGKRDITTVPTQALFLMNNPFVLRQSEEMAKRILKVEGLNQNGRLDLAYRLALSRLPTDDERTLFKDYIEEFRKSFLAVKPNSDAQLATWANVCQTLFQMAQFRYVY